MEEKDLTGDFIRKYRAFETLCREAYGFTYTEDGKRDKRNGILEYKKKSRRLSVVQKKRLEDILWMRNKLVHEEAIVITVTPEILEWLDEITRIAEEEFGKDKGTPRPHATPAPKTSARKTDSDKLEAYIRSCSATMQKRIDGLDKEYAEKCIRKDLRDDITNSAKSRLASLRNAKSFGEAEGIFKAFQKAFGDIKNHPIVLKAELSRYKEEQEKNMSARIADLPESSVKTANAFVRRLKAAETIESARKINKEFNTFVKQVVGKKSKPKSTAEIYEKVEREDLSSSVKADPEVSEAPIAPSTDYSADSRRVPVRALIIAAGCVALAVLIVCLCVFGNWTVRQYVIGVVVGLLLVGVGVLAAYFSHKVLDWKTDIAPFFVALIVLIANFVLACIFGMRYYIIFVWISAYVIISSIVTTVVAFIKHGWKIPCVAEAVLAVLALVLGLAISFGNWTLVQTIIGEAVSILLFGFVGALWSNRRDITFMSNNDFDEDSDKEIYGILFFVIFAVSVANCVLFAVYALQYKIIFIIVGVSAVVAGGFTTVSAFIEGAREWKKPKYVFGIIGAVLTALIGAAFVLELIFV